MGDSWGESAIRLGEEVQQLLPSGELSADIVGAAEEAILSQSAAEEGQLTETDGPGFALDPSSRGKLSAGSREWNSVGRTRRG